MKVSSKRNTSLVSFGSLISGKIRLPCGHFNKMEDPDEFSEYSIVSKEALEEDLPEAEMIGWEANTKESAPDRPKPRIKPINNLIDNFISKTKSDRKEMLQKPEAPKDKNFEEPSQYTL